MLRSFSFRQLVSLRAGVVLSLLAIALIALRRRKPVVRTSSLRGSRLGGTLVDRRGGWAIARTAHAGIAASLFGSVLLGKTVSSGGPCRGHEQSARFVGVERRCSSLDHGLRILVPLSPCGRSPSVAAYDRRISSSTPPLPAWLNSLFVACDRARGPERCNRCSRNSLVRLDTQSRGLSAIAFSGRVEIRALL